jgi:uncharacterized protein YbjT (DUF2867 family)
MKSSAGISRTACNDIVVPMRIFVAGATGCVGFPLVQRLKALSHSVGALSRSPANAEKLERIADSIHVCGAVSAVPGLNGAEIVVSALGAPVTLSAKEKRSYLDIDYAANMNLLAAARRAGVRRFVYLSAWVQPGYANTAYIRAHEDFVAELIRSGISFTVVRPTGIFPALDDYVRLARRGLVTVIGDGRARTNPVHPEDVAGHVLAHLTSGPEDLAIGGPDVFTRREIAELAFHVLSKPPRVLHLPPAVFRWSSRAAGLVNPRLRDLFEFVTAVSTSDCVAPVLGRLRLEDHFRAVAGAAAIAAGRR